MEDDLSTTFMEFEELYTKEIIHRNILVKFACKKANPFFLVFGCVSSIWMCSSVWRCGYYIDECVSTNVSQL